MYLIYLWTPRGWLCILKKENIRQEILRTDYDTITQENLTTIIYTPICGIKLGS